MLGFIFIGGWGNVKKQLVGNAGLHTCPVCHQLTRWDVYKIDKRATVYFVPVYTYASEKVVLCSNCHNGSEATDLEIANLRAQSESAAPGAAVPAPVAAPPVAPVPPVAPRRAAPVPVQPAPPRQPAPPPAAPHTTVPAGPPSAPAHVQPAQIAPAPPGADRRVVAWLSNVSAMLLKYGYFAQDVRWYEKPYDVPCELSATFVQSGTTYVVTLHRKEKFAQQYAAALENDPAVQQATQVATHLLKLIDKRVLRVHDARGVTAGQLEAWEKTVGWYPLPK